jgi:DNA-binding NarL/FixJ family response regulator
MSDDLKNQVRNFIEGGLCLVVEPSSSFSACLQSFLSNHGVPLSQVKVCRKYDEAKQLLLSHKPKFLVTEYDLTPMHGLSLVELQETLYPDNQRVAIVVTKNSSDTVVAEAAEGAVDAFILKPFSTDVLQEKLSAVFQKKLQPSPYQKKISDAQQKFTASQFKEALLEFRAAKSIDPKPTLACYFSGKTLQKMGDIEGALKEYREGRTYQPLHYKCLIGEYEAMMVQQKYADAYNLVPIIRANYPISSQRLGQICTSAVFAYQFDDLPDLYDLFLKLEARPSTLCDMVALALFSGGRYWIKKNDMTNAMSFFNMAITVKGRDIQYLDKVISELLRINAIPQAETVLSKILPGDVGSPTHSQLLFRVNQRLLPPDQVMEAGRKLVLAGHGNPEIYKTLVEMLVTAGKMTLAETIISRAAKDDPKLQPILYALFPKEKT